MVQAACYHSQVEPPSLMGPGICICYQAYMLLHVALLFRVRSSLGFPRELAEMEPRRNKRYMSVVSTRTLYVYVHVHVYRSIYIYMYMYVYILVFGQSVIMYHFLLKFRSCY